jgi:alkanesulfonate monooxygenase SsuD/methylene tetrahydromethanopterin reductase-like flavin-dependent oxidoreductase (luciferase family)
LTRDPDHGVESSLRWRVIWETLQAWLRTRDDAEYHGEFVKSEPVALVLRPLQKPYPPILIGSNVPGRPATRGRALHKDVRRGSKRKSGYTGEIRALSSVG